MLVQVALVLVALLGVGDALEQTVAVRGSATCTKSAVTSITVYIMEADIDPDDVLASTITTEDLKFELSGSEDENFKISPYLKIEHNCGTNCTRSSFFTIPIEAIRAESPYEMDGINLDHPGWADRDYCK